MGRLLIMVPIAMTISLGSAGAMAGQAPVLCPPGAIQVRIAQAGPNGSVVTAPDKIANGPYRAFVSAVLDQLPVVLASARQCQGAAQGKPVMEAVFVHSPLIGVAGQTPPDRRKPSGGKPSITHQLTSPWVIFDRDEAASPPLRAVFIWNERQVLLDQALLAGAPAPANPETSPITYESLQDWTVRYVTDVLQLGSSANEGAALSDLAKTMPPDLLWRMISAREDAALSNLAKTMPPDLLWSMISAGQSTRGPFRMEVIYIINNALAKISKRQPLLSVKLIENQLINNANLKILKSILEAHQIIDFNGYEFRNRPFVWPE
jgi:hypothetical protein